MSKEPLVEFVNINKSFHEHKKIGPISFTIQKGEILALCGGNGAGKSTLIKMLTGILNPSGGSLQLEGTPADPTSKTYKASFSYMPDDMAFPRQLTGWEILTFYSSLQGVETVRAEGVLKKVGLYEDRNRMVKNYSKGMQQRLSFAQALLSDAPLLILDEPTNGLDPYWVFRFKEIVREERDKGKTILFSTHILSMVEEIADTAVFLEDGKLLHHEKVNVLTKSQEGYVSLEKVFFERQMAVAK
ncbi:ABC transporter ATP-binding protein [Bacillus sp. ISL-47]|uniref:ABC transporter ATP-binding protein n=1 Tax=Bacillus sp. ISL-47 TaxID=2819130 RepID=UPI001BE96129|nr:ABC transporter ATP-binding protein [Bacillus sp. ISL-47]MBT2688459.1 ABC transporter ATP-binding protein [Bacillus sp. ISL-47]MBT2707225.1 ABC transporter ATP-binding protein [Pseudomonas sp. ISL-84]